MLLFKFENKQYNHTTCMIYKLVYIVSSMSYKNIFQIVYRIERIVSTI